MQVCRFLLPVVMFVAPAVSQTVLTGHRLGESVAQFLAAEPELQSHVESCRMSEPKPLTPEQIHALSKYDVEALARGVYQNVLSSTATRFHLNKLKRLPSRSDLEDLARQGMPITIDKRPPDEIATCNLLLALLATASPSTVRIDSPPNSKPNPVTWEFENGTLVQIDIDFHGVGFSTIANEFTARLGVPPNGNTELDTPNLYGATLHASRKASWLTPELFAVLQDEEGLVDGQTRATIVSRARYDAWKRTQSKKALF